MPRTFRITVFFLSALLLAAGAVAFLWNRGTFSPAASNSETLKLSSSDAGGAGELAEHYANSDFGFSFQRPEGFKVTSMTDELGETILVQKEGSAKDGFQVFISPFDEAGPITQERITQDLPEMVIEQPQTVLIGRKPETRNPKPETNPNDQNSNDQDTDGVWALIFFSQDESFGRTREVWFVWPEDPTPAGNYLYQITSPAEFDEQLSKIMATFQFE